MQQLYEFMERRVRFTTSEFVRYAYPAINWDAHMLGLVGPRGVGKTTLVLQRIRDSHQGGKALYITADHLYFASHTLLETAEAFSRDGGTHLFVDEVHKYPGWSRELKNIYDSLPDMHVLFTGSSVLDIRKGEADLSRRAPIFHMQGLSFREFLAMRHGIEAPRLSLERILSHEAGIPGVAHPLPYFKEYLRCGYYPFGDDPDFETQLGQVVAQTLESDIPQFAGMNASTGRKLLMLMSIVSTMTPFKPNMSKLAAQIGVSRNNVEDYLGYLEKAGMIAQLRSGAGGIGELGKVQKVFLDNTNIQYTLGGGATDVGTARETFFLNQMHVNHEVRSSPVSDFLVDGVTFEVGGRGKGTAQLRGAERGYVAADDVEYGHGRIVPLWAFGLNY